jgi:hypothetical protein
VESQSSQSSLTLTEPDCMSEREILESGMLKELLGLGESFLASLEESWKEDKVDIKTAIQQTLRENFANADFEEMPKTNVVLESIGFGSATARWLAKLLGDQIKDEDFFLEKVQHFIQVRLDALVASLPEWLKTEKSFEVENSKEKKKKQYNSILIPFKNGLAGDSNEDLKLLLKKPLASDPSKTVTWYHATNFKEAQEILKNGFSFRRCLKNRNFSHMDGIYFTDSIQLAKKLFLHNAINDYAVYFNIECNKQQKKKQTNQIVVLAFTYDKEENNLLENYKEHSIDLMRRKSEGRLKKIVTFFSQDPLSTNYPTMDEHGLNDDYEHDIEYIIGPHSTIDLMTNDVYINRDLTQLCVRCVGRINMKMDFENLIRKEVFVVTVDDSEIASMHNYCSN